MRLLNGMAALIAATAMATSSVLGASIYDSAVVHYDFSSINSGVVNDLGTAGINITATTPNGSSATLVPGPAPSFGNALYLSDPDNGTTQSSVVGASMAATAGSDGALNTTRDTPFSVAAWLKLPGVIPTGSNTSAGGIYLASKADSSGQFVGWLLHVTRTGQLEAIMRKTNSGTGTDGYIGFDSTALITDTAWHSVGFSFHYDSTDATDGARMYIDGSSVALTATPHLNGLTGASDIDLSTNSPFTVSGRNGGQVDDGGTIDDLAVWKSALSAQDFATIGTIASTVPEPASLSGIIILGALARRRMRRSV